MYTYCPGCGGVREDCDGTTNSLRRFADWNDLASHCDEATIVRWVNELANRQAEACTEHDDEAAAAL
jgi:4-alpha-glucanotransferase